MTSLLHEERLQAALAEIPRDGAARVLDLGCGDGDLFLRLAAEPGIARLVGVDVCPAALERLRARIAGQGARAGAVDLRLASLTAAGSDLSGFDCAVMIEVIEHFAPGQLSQLERAVFHRLMPRRVVVTTPNAEFNPLLGVPAHRFRHPDHRFEWSRAQFRAWAARVAATARYEVRFQDVGGCHPVLGAASQMVVFDRPTVG